MQYTTLEQVKRFLQISDNVLNDEIKRLINVVTQEFDYYIGGNLGQKTYIEAHKINKKDVFTLDNYIAGDIDIISYSFIPSDNSGVFIKNTEIVTCDKGLVYLSNNFTGIIKIEYTSGLLEVPYDVENACLLRIKKYLAEGISANKIDGLEDIKIKSKSIDSIKIEYFSSLEQNSQDDIYNYQKVLNNYKKSLNPSVI